MNTSGNNHAIELDFQARIVEAGFRQTDFMLKCIRDLDPSFLQDNLMRNCFLLIKAFYLEHDRIPDKVEVAQEAKRASQNAFISQSDFESICDKLLELGDIKDDQCSYASSEFDKFITRKKSAAVLMQAPALVAQDKLAEVVQNLNDVVVDSATSDKGIGYFDDFKARQAEALQLSQVGVIPTFIPGVDMHIGGGLSKKEMGFLVGETNIGKSIFLVNIGKGAVLAGYRVLHVTLEMSSLKTMLRYDLAFLSRSAQAIRSSKAISEADFTKLAGQFKDKLFVHEAPPSHFSIIDLERLIQSYKARDLPIDVVILDYADLMVSLRNYKDKRHELADIYYSCRAAAVKHELALWTVTQATRAAFGRDTVTSKDIAEDIEKARIADIVLGIGASDETRANNKIHVKVAKCRDAKRGDAITLITEFEKMTLRPDGTQGI